MTTLHTHFPGSNLSSQLELTFFKPYLRWMKDGDAEKLEAGHERMAGKWMNSDRVRDLDQRQATSPRRIANWEPTISAARTAPSNLRIAKRASWGQIDFIIMSHYNEVMKVITVRNVPDDVYAALVNVAGQNRRSLQQQALLMLERIRTLAPGTSLTQAASIRNRLSGRKWGSLVEEIRQDRER